MRINHITKVLAGLFLAVSAGASRAQSVTAQEAARGVLTRLLPDKAERFALESIPHESGQDVFEIETLDGKVILRGSSGVAICSALNWYLKHVCLASISWCGSQLALPDPLPALDSKIRRVSPHRYRYLFNFCAFSYSMAFWDWQQWERMIDWMALSGVNMPLAITGQEATWQAMYRKLGLSNQQIGEFLVGPAYLPFGWMGCIDGWGGPLPQSWIDSHRALQKQILARERELGMTPVLQGFTGHVPAAMKERFPDAKFQQLPSWAGFPGTYFLDPMDPLFIEVGKAFIEEQTRQFGTDHLYASDTFIEMSPPSSNPAFLADMGRAVFGAMKAGDPEAVWIMQSWIFTNNPKFWKPPQAKALFGAVPDDRMILLDMTGDMWQATEGFYGKPWICTLIHNFGNKVDLHGALGRFANCVHQALTGDRRDQLRGLGIIMEGLGYNPVIYDLMSDLLWRQDKPELESWIRGYARRRYGRRHPQAERAWEGLLATAYSFSAAAETPICAYPKLDRNKRWLKRECPYDPARLEEVGRQLLDCADDLSDLDTYRFDLVHVVRQVLVNVSRRRHDDIIAAYQAKDRRQLEVASGRFLQLIRDMDELLATRPEFLLGSWLADAKRWATNEQERRLYEWNARNQITLWASSEGQLHDYARKQWSGLLNGFYLKRWETFLQRLDEALAQGKAFDEGRCTSDLRHWGGQWTHQTDEHPVEPTGDAVAVARRLWAKYCSQPQD